MPFCRIWKGAWRSYQNFLWTPTCSMETVFYCVQRYLGDAPWLPSPLPGCGCLKYSWSTILKPMCIWWVISIVFLNALYRCMFLIVVFKNSLETKHCYITAPQLSLGLSPCNLSYDEEQTNNLMEFVCWPATRMLTTSSSWRRALDQSGRCHSASPFGKRLSSSLVRTRSRFFMLLI